jgi:histone-lysine N-methyltransferase SETMAR
MRRVLARWMPRLLTSEQMVVRVKMCQQYDRRYREEGDYFLNRVITCDETWIHFFEPESKRQSSVWKHPSSSSPTKAIISKSVMAIIFCDTYGVVLNHFVPPKTTVTGNYYATLLRTELMAAIRRKRPHLLRSGFILHHNNAPSHSSLVVMDTLEKLAVELLLHPPYSPDAAICDFLLFQTLNKSVFVVRNLIQDVPWTDSCGRCQKCMGRYIENELSF